MRVLAQGAVTLLMSLIAISSVIVMSFLQVSLVYDRAVKKAEESTFTVIDLSPELQAWSPPHVAVTDRQAIPPRRTIAGCSARFGMMYVEKGLYQIGVTTTTCGSDRSSLTLLRSIESAQAPASGTVEPAFSRHPELTYEINGGIGRAWAQANVVSQIELTCTDKATDQCLVVSRDITRAFSTIVPGVVEDTFPETAHLTQIILIYPFSIWFLFVLGARLTALIRKRSLVSPTTLSGYTDQSKLVAKVFRARYGNAAAKIISSVAVCAAAFGFASQGFRMLGWFIAAITASGISIALFKRFRPILRQVRPTTRFRSKMGPRSLIGVAAERSASAAAVFVVVLYVTIVVTVGKASQMSVAYLVDQMNAQATLPITLSSQIREVALIWLIAIGNDSQTLILFGLIPSLPLAFLAQRLGQRLSAGSAVEAVSSDSLGHNFVLLRSFEQDHARIEATLSRRGFLSKLMPFRGRAFEEIVASSLSRYGPVLAVSPPGQKLSTLGAAKAAMPHDGWQNSVREWTEDALAVVVIASGGLNPGFKWEISLLGWDLPHARLILVVPPSKSAGLEYGWDNFRSVAGEFARFEGLNAGPFISGTHAVSRASDTSWVAFGANERSEASYTLALNAAVDAQIERWRDEHAAQHR